MITFLVIILCLVFFEEIVALLAMGVMLAIPVIGALILFAMMLS